MPQNFCRSVDYSNEKFLFFPTNGVESNQSSKFEMTYNKHVNLRRWLKFLETKCLNWPTRTTTTRERKLPLDNNISGKFALFPRNSLRFYDRYHANDTLFSFFCLRAFPTWAFFRVCRFFSRALRVRAGHCHGFDACVFSFFLFPNDADCAPCSERIDKSYNSRNVDRYRVKNVSIPGCPARNYCSP